MRKDGYWKGYLDYRYGRQAAPVTLAGKTKPGGLNKAKRVHVVDQVTGILRGWRTSPFENEGAIVHGLRSGMCLEGQRWARADMEATAIVAEGLRRIRAERP
ncbi:MAG TPA: hypothetical protein VGN75_15645, partial [Kaistia sp.]|nr:hypothetical protein [Kaistia sp.]